MADGVHGRWVSLVPLRIGDRIEGRSLQSVIFQVIKKIRWKLSKRRVFPVSSCPENSE